MLPLLHGVGDEQQALLSGVGSGQRQPRVFASRRGIGKAGNGGGAAGAQGAHGRAVVRRQGRERGPRGRSERFGVLDILQHLWTAASRALAEHAQREQFTLLGHGGTMFPSLVRLSFCGESSRASAPERHLKTNGMSVNMRSMTGGVGEGRGGIEVSVRVSEDGWHMLGLMEEQGAVTLSCSPMELHSWLWDDRESCTLLLHVKRAAATHAIVTLFAGKVANRKQTRPKLLQKVDHYHTQTLQYAGNYRQPAFALFIDRLHFLPATRWLHE